MVKEYQVVYLVNGHGYTKELPWLDYVSDDLEDTLETLASLKEYHSECDYDTEEWIEVRDVSEWRRLDSSD